MEDSTQESFAAEAAALKKRIAELEARAAALTRAEARLAHLNAVLLAVRNVNQLIVTEKDRDRLIREACRILVSTRGYSGAWIALLDKAGKPAATAEAGIGEGFASLKNDLAQARFCPCAEAALRQAAPVIVEDRIDACPLPGHHAGQGVITLRLKHGAVLYGVLSVWIPRDHVTDAEEQALVREVAGDIAFGLHAIDAEKALRRERDFTQNLVEASPAFFVAIDPDGKVLLMNAAMRRALGYSREEIEGKDYLETVIPEEDREAVAADFRDVKEGRQKALHENAVLTRDGRRRIVEWHGRPVFREDGGLDYFFGVGIEITERRRLESRIQQAQKMEAIGTLAGGIAHDFNNILAAIMGYTELATLQISNEEKVRKHLNQVLSAAMRAKDLVQQILSFSRQQAGGRIPVQARLIIKEAIKLLRASLPATMEIREDIAPDVGLVEADPTRIHQVMMNLCTNAVQAMEGEKGVLSIDLHNVEIPGDTPETGTASPPVPELQPGRYLCLGVRDTGCGMTPEVQKRIFDPYFTTREKEVGTGLGLAVVHEIVRSYGGAVTVESRPGKGSTFRVYLPLMEQKPAATRRESPLDSLPGGNERVLFVDDEPSLSRMGKEMLERLGYRVTAMTGGMEALETFRRDPERFDLVITDMTMPCMTGLELAEEIRKLRPGMPVILCTGYSRHVTEEKARLMGIRSLLMKPLVMRELAEAVRDALQGETRP